MRDQKNLGWLSLAVGLLLLAETSGRQCVVLADDDLPPGELPFSGVMEERPHHLELISGKLFKVSTLRVAEEGYSYTSDDEGQTWQRGGPTVYCRGLTDVGGSMTFQRSAIRVQDGKHRGRIVLPYYLEMDGAHPDYSRKQRGGYALFKGKKITFETHTYVPEMAGTFFLLSDDEGKAWKKSKDYLVGYFKDGLMGHMSCEEPTVAELKDGRLLCYIRGTCGRILKSYSSGGGESWTKVDLTDLAMSNSPVMLKRLPRRGTWPWCGIKCRLMRSGKATGVAG